MLKNVQTSCCSSHLAYSLFTDWHSSGWHMNDTSYTIYMYVKIWD